LAAASAGETKYPISESDTNADRGSRITAFADERSRFGRAAATTLQLRDHRLGQSHPHQTRPQHDVTAIVRITRKRRPSRKR